MSYAFQLFLDKRPLVGCWQVKAAKLGIQNKIANRNKKKRRDEVVHRCDLILITAPGSHRLMTHLKNCFGDDEQI